MDSIVTPPYVMQREGRRLSVHALDNERTTIAVGWAVPFKEQELEATFRLFACSPKLLAAARRALLTAQSLGLALEPAVMALAEAIDEATRKPAPGVKDEAA